MTGSRFEFDLKNCLFFFCFDNYTPALILLQIVTIDCLDVIKKLRYFDIVIKVDPLLEPDWDEDNVDHIARHGLRPEQVEEVYYNEGPFPTLALKTKKKGRVSEYRYRLWGADASGICIEAIIAPYAQYGLWRCVTAFPMSPSTQTAYIRRIKR